MSLASEDRISSLSNDILRHILSFNPTKDAVTTGVLSKRWIDLWHSIPSFDFSNVKLGNNIESILRFNQFVYSVLVSRDIAGYRSINSFYLNIEYSNPNHVNSLSIPSLTTWVNLVVKRKVKHLHLNLHLLNGLVYFAPKLPNIIFRCKTLVVLKLSWFHVKGFSFSSVRFGFPSLKTLHLERIKFNDDRDFLLLLAGCPVLEDFKACDVEISDEVSERRILKVIERLNLNKLIRADITRCSCYFPMEVLFNLEFLRIQLSEMYTPYDFSTYHNLTHLVINNIWDTVLQVLHHCPKLQNLDLYQKTHSWWDEHIEGQEQESWVDPEFPPQCLSLFLRTCTIRDFAFADLQHNIRLARYILNNATVLQTMTIWSDKEQPEIERELSSCPRASATCQLSVY